MIWRNDVPFCLPFRLPLVTGHSLAGEQIAVELVVQPTKEGVCLILVVENLLQRAGATGRLFSLCDADTLKMSGAAGRPAARTSFVEVPDRDDPRHASRVPQASFELMLPGIDLHGSGATGQLAARASRRGPVGACYGSGDFAWQTPGVSAMRGRRTDPRRNKTGNSTNAVGRAASPNSSAPGSCGHSRSFRRDYESDQ
jgi:hypothetical protein